MKDTTSSAPLTMFRDESRFTAYYTIIGGEKFTGDKIRSSSGILAVFGSLKRKAEEQKGRGEEKKGRKKRTAS